MPGLLDVRDLQISYQSPGGEVRAVDHMTFSIERGEIFGLAGESGCGKSTTAFGIARLLRPPAKIRGGTILLDGTNITNLSDAEFDRLRWTKISIVLQSAMNNLNPVMRIRDQLADAIFSHESISRSELEERVKSLVNLVDIPRNRLDSFPHELSGGMRQRVVLAMALALKPDLIIMDEPTTALDVVVQHNILRKVVELQKSLQFSVLLISHDLPLMLEICQRIGIMYAGKLVEISNRDEMLNRPKHPYTRGLLEAFPSMSAERRRLGGISGTPADLRSPPPGCRFHPRCALAIHQCNSEEPPLRQYADEFVACHRYEGEVSPRGSGVATGISE